MSAFDGLRHEPTPVDPDPRFARSLRERLAAALAPPVELPPRAVVDDGDPVSGTARSITPYLCVADATRAIGWYGDVLGGVETVRYVGDDGRIGHAELDLGGGVHIFLSDEYPDIGVLSPTSLDGTAVSLHLLVDDVDRIWETATAGGAIGQRPPEDQPYGERSAVFVDPFGHRWMIQSTIASPTTEEISAAMDGFDVVAGPGGSDRPPAEIGYVTFHVDDAERATRFYAELFGWTLAPGRAGPGYRHVANTRLPVGFTPHGVGERPTILVRVDDVDAASTRVVELGGEVVERSESPAGALVECRDDQGLRIDLWQPAPGY